MHNMWQVELQLETKQPPLLVTFPGRNEYRIVGLHLLGCCTCMQREQDVGKARCEKSKFESFNPMLIVIRPGPFLDCADVEIPTLADAASGLDLSGTWMQKNTDESLSSRCNLALETTWTPRIYFRMQWKIDHCSSCGNSPSARQFHICR
ncbi:uncharacterized protein LOC126596515 [Malus sylvestris]|uniref:uncharacterized protein LOC126596515 n=1 Tax=Malus sylvestris TaxID=3752 RepID=UPI0021AD1283|nr:uncharacterized protein LOC126596515 [Malus sylvestris]